MNCSLDPPLNSAQYHWTSLKPTQHLFTTLDKFISLLFPSSNNPLLLKIKTRTFTRCVFTKRHKENVSIFHTSEMQSFSQDLAGCPKLACFSKRNIRSQIHIMLEKLCSHHILPPWNFLWGSIIIILPLPLGRTLIPALCSKHDQVELYISTDSFSQHKVSRWDTSTFLRRTIQFKGQIPFHHNEVCRSHDKPYSAADSAFVTVQSAIWRDGAA